ncbi:MAG: energy transducer TonB [Burkholderiaceae bacterium]|jgi:TonB family protein|nr:energy transducer TonB [Burkholderiaceae bacterium]
MAPRCAHGIGGPAAVLLALLLPSWVAAQPASGSTRAPCSRDDLTYYLTYPFKAARCGLEGTVVVRFDVGADGGVVNPVIVSSTHRIFNRTVLEAAQRMQCGASSGGSRIQISVDFKLVDGPASKDQAHACVDDKPLQAADPGGA